MWYFNTYNNTLSSIEKNQLNTVLSYSDNEIKNKVKLSWRKKKLFLD